MLTQTGKSSDKKKWTEKKAGAIDPEFGRELPADRRILLSLRKRTGIRGKGACATQVAIGFAENSTVAKVLMGNYAAVSESCLNTDTSPAYTDVGKQSRLHRTVAHAKELIGPNGENNNQAEEFNARFDRMEKGIHLNIEPKYLLDYAAEGAFRSDTRRLPNGRQLV